MDLPRRVAAAMTPAGAAPGHLRAVATPPRDAGRCLHRGAAPTASARPAWPRRLEAAAAAGRTAAPACRSSAAAPGGDEQRARLIIRSAAAPVAWRSRQLDGDHPGVENPSRPERPARSHGMEFSDQGGEGRRPRSAARRGAGGRFTRQGGVEEAWRIAGAARRPAMHPRAGAAGSEDTGRSATRPCSGRATGSTVPPHERREPRRRDPRRDYPDAEAGRRADTPARAPASSADRRLLPLKPRRRLVRRRVTLPDEAERRRPARPRRRDRRFEIETPAARAAARMSPPGARPAAGRRYAR